MIFLLIPLFGITQEYIPKSSTYHELDVSIGWMGNSNSNFPKHRLQKNIFLNFGQDHSGGLKDWEYYLNGPKTGISLGFSDLGNPSNLGYAYSILPYVEFTLFPEKTDNLSLLLAFGGSYVTKKYDLETNPYNKGVSTHVNWSYKSSILYNVFKGDKSTWRIGLGYFHYSNGHVRKPNRGYNSVLLSVLASFEKKPNFVDSVPSNIPSRSIYWYYEARLGVGINSFSDVFKDKKPVYAVSLSGGKVINRTFKYGLGLYYHFYQHYYDYIINDETLIRTQEPQFANRSILNASRLGIFGSAELLLGQVGMEMNIGLNVFKPFYIIDWQLNKGYTQFVNGEEIIVLGEMNSYYKIKKHVFSRMGLKYYFIDMDSKSRHNIYVGAFINANLGQADFSELTVGYVHKFDF